MKLLNKIKNNETVQRLGTENPPYFKPWQKFGLSVASIGLVVKIACICFPATMPIGLAAIGVDMFTTGLAIAGMAKLPNKDK